MCGSMALEAYGRGASVCATGVLRGLSGLVEMLRHSSRPILAKCKILAPFNRKLENPRCFARQLRVTILRVVQKPAEFYATLRFLRLSR